jgi:hypothetical protein
LTPQEAAALVVEPGLAKVILPLPRLVKAAGVVFIEQIGRGTK